MLFGTPECLDLLGLRRWIGAADPEGIEAFTVVLPGDLHRALALFASLREHHPGLAFHLVMADRRRSEWEGLATDLGLDGLLFADDPELGAEAGWLFQWNADELDSALVPRAAKAILDRQQCEGAVYFSPEIVVFSPLDDLLAETREASIVRAPSLRAPDEADPRRELEALGEGVLDAGFFALRDSAEGRTFLDLWISHMELTLVLPETLGEIEAHWSAHSLVLFPGCSLLRNERFNVTAATAEGRRLRGTFDEGFQVGDERLGFFRFAGSIGQIARDHGVDDVSADRTLKMLGDWYLRRIDSLAALALDDWSLGRYGDGARIEDWERRLYAETAEALETFRDPFSSSLQGMTFREWAARERCGERTEDSTTDDPEP